MQDQLRAIILAENVRLGNVCAQQVAQQAKAVGEAIVKPVTQAWGRGDHAEAITRGGLELGTLLLPIAKAGLAGRSVSKQWSTSMLS